MVKVLMQNSLSLSFFDLIIRLSTKQTNKHKNYTPVVFSTTHDASSMRVIVKTKYIYLFRPNICIVHRPLRQSVETKIWIQFIEHNWIFEINIVDTPQSKITTNFRRFNDVYCFIQIFCFASKHFQRPSVMIKPWTLIILILIPSQLPLITCSLLQNNRSCLVHHKLSSSYDTRSIINQIKKLTSITMQLLEITKKSYANNISITSHKKYHKKKKQNETLTNRHQSVITY